MRPAILFPLFADTRTLTGVGPKMAKLMERVAGQKVVDILFDLPVGVIDRSYGAALSEAQEGRIATAIVTVLDHVPPRASSAPYRIRCSDKSSLIELVYFHASGDWLSRSFPLGKQRAISGRIERRGTKLQMVHPDYVELPEEVDSIPRYESVYRLTEGLSLKMRRKAVMGALAKLPEFPEWLDPALVKSRAWSNFDHAIRAAHAPESDTDLALDTPARQRLAFDELLANQLALFLIRARMRAGAGRALRGKGQLKEKALAALPFKLTQAQLAAVAEIETDTASTSRMLRLLQGDVGSGKTIVALLALLNAIEAGAQSALMAPTEILVRQHAATLQPICDATGVRLAVLTGRERGAARDQVLEELASGRIDLLVGTHALFSEDVSFRDLGLAVIDEQHRFGVHQRMQLQAKGGVPADVLVMTATPIPRTLALTAYGDMDISRLTGRPPGRQPIETRVLGTERLDDVVSRLSDALKRGARAYWICPLVEESEKVDLAAAEDRAQMLAQALGIQVGLVHGRMKPAARDEAMLKFKNGDLSLLVATTVVEVGVDVPEATIMVVEHAERFGLAQLHQLRGRIGRGKAKSSCLLMYQGPLSETAKARLRNMR